MNGLEQMRVWPMHLLELLCVVGRRERIGDGMVEHGEAQICKDTYCALACCCVWACMGYMCAGEWHPRPQGRQGRAPP